MQFRVIIGLELVGTTTTFGEAFRLFHKKVIEQVAGGVSKMVFDTCNAIEMRSEDGRRQTMDFYQSAGAATQLGLLAADGSIVEDAPEPEECAVRSCFDAAALEVLAVIGQELQAICREIEEDATRLCEDAGDSVEEGTA